MEMKFIYVAGPYSGGDMLMNVFQAIEAGNKLLSLGFVPLVPHLFHFWNLVFYRPESEWLALGGQWLLNCDGLLRLPGESEGADAEVEMMESLGRKVFYSIDELTEAKEWGKR